MEAQALHVEGKLDGDCSALAACFYDGIGLRKEGFRFFPLRFAKVPLLLEFLDCLELFL